MAEITRRQILAVLKDREDQRENLGREIEGINLFLQALDSVEGLKKEVAKLKGEREASSAALSTAKNEAETESARTIEKEKKRTEEAVAEHIKKRQDLERSIAYLTGKQDGLKKKVDELDLQVADAAKEAEKTIEASRQSAEHAIIEHQKAMDAMADERKKIEKAHEQYRKSVGL